MAGAKTTLPLCPSLVVWYLEVTKCNAREHVSTTNRSQEGFMANTSHAILGSETRVEVESRDGSRRVDSRSNRVARASNINVFPDLNVYKRHSKKSHFLVPNHKIGNTKGQQGGESRS